MSLCLKSCEQLLSLIREGQENLIILRTFSKGYGLAGHIGYAIGHEKLISQLNRVRQPFNVNAMARQLRWPLWMIMLTNKTAIASQQGLDQLTRGLQVLGIEGYHRPLIFYWLKWETGRNTLKRERRKVIVRPMNGYGLPEFIHICRYREAK